MPAPGTRGVPGFAQPPQHQVKKTKTAYTGELDNSHVEAGFGMGMAVTNARRSAVGQSGGESAGTGGNFSALVGLKRTESGLSGLSAHRNNAANSSGAYPSKKIRPGHSTGASTVASQQFVFGASSMAGGGSAFGHDDNNSQMGGGYSERSLGFGAPSNSGFDSSRAGAAMASRMGAPAGGLSRGTSTTLSRTASLGAVAPGNDDSQSQKTSLFAKLNRR